MTIEGAEYKLDPAFKAYTDIFGIDIGQFLNYDRNQFLSQAQTGATVDNDYVQNINESAIGTMLGIYTNNLIANLRLQYPNSDMQEIIGGRRIVSTQLANYSDGLPFPWAEIDSWDEIPAQYIATIRIQCEGIDTTFRIPEIAGKRLTLTYTTGDFQPQLHLEGGSASRPIWMLLQAANDIGMNSLSRPGTRLSGRIPVMV